MHKEFLLWKQNIWSLYIVHNGKIIQDLSTSMWLVPITLMKSEGSYEKVIVCPSVNKLKRFFRQVLYLRSQILPQREPAGREIWSPGWMKDKQSWMSSFVQNMQGRQEAFWPGICAQQVSAACQVTAKSLFISPSRIGRRMLVSVGHSHTCAQKEIYFEVARFYLWAETWWRNIPMITPLPQKTWI